MADKGVRTTYDPMNNTRTEYPRTQCGSDCHVGIGKCGAANHIFERESVNSTRVP